MSSWHDDDHRRHGPPPRWWPANEAWPPSSGRMRFDRRRERFVRRSGWWSFWPLWVLFWIIINNLGGFRTRGAPFGGAIIILLACAAAAGGVAVIIRRIAGPIADIVAAADRIAHRDYRVRVREPERGPAWVGDTARAFNAMVEELEKQDQARRHLMADVAHELRTPLAVVQGKLEGLIDGVYPRDNERLQELLDETRLLARLIEDLRTLSTAESGALALSKEPTDVPALVDDVVSSMAARADEHGVLLTAEKPSNEIEPVSIDPLRIREVLMNLVSNALRSTPRGGRVTLTVARQASAVEVCVADTGSGIPPDQLLRIFDRFYKGVESSGSGLGLTIARSLIEAHGGTIRAASTPGAGTRITIALPQ